MIATSGATDLVDRDGRIHSTCHEKFSRDECSRMATTLDLVERFMSRQKIGRSGLHAMLCQVHTLLLKVWC